MKKAVWITFFVAIVGVNLVCWVGYQLTGIYVPIFLRLTVILGLTVMATVFAGTFMLIEKLEQEKPLAGAQTRMTLQASTHTEDPPPADKPQASDPGGTTKTGESRGPE